MSLNFILLSTIYDNVYGLKMKLNYSDPKFYTGGVPIKGWSKLTYKQKKDALAKDWYVYFSYRNPETKKLVRQTPIKAGVNRFKTKRERILFMYIIKRALIKILEAGYTPNADNSTLISKLSTSNVVDEKETETIPKKVEQPTKVLKKVTPAPLGSPLIEEPSISIQEAFDFALKIKKRSLSPNSYSGYHGPLKQFEKWLEENEISDIKAITKKTVVQYLNSVLARTSPRTRNNARTSLSAIFTTLEDNEIIEDNFIPKIKPLSTKPTRNKTFTPKQESNLQTYMEKNDQLLLSFVHFISLCFLRPIEVCRLKVKDIDIADKKIYVKAKNKKVKIKIIPEILLNLLPDLSNADPEHFVFTPYEIGGEWDVPERDKRNYYSKRFKKVKDHFKLGIEYGLYSYRHTYITKLYREIRKELNPSETRSTLLGITGHSTLTSLEKYLRDIDAELPEDYSEFLQPSSTKRTQND
ncbi:integrase [Maribacter hydrothermalis]|uniref:Integrase n=2 Tax=Maribacter hydrothermalis TaxID=1836467 RepID=A0A1B7ZD45_9FLAO|nr:integrase [Maribacter hydrothermalis]OBR41039.1 integrase [Maribacter hydrothermalis]